MTIQRVNSQIRRHSASSLKRSKSSFEKVSGWILRFSVSSELEALKQKEEVFPVEEFADRGVHQEVFFFEIAVEPPIDFNIPGPLFGHGGNRVLFVGQDSGEMLKC